MTETAERRYLGRFSQPSLGLIVHRAGQPADADAFAVAARLLTADGTVVFDRPAIREAQGVYETVLSSAETATPGQYTLRWSYAIDSAAQTYDSYLEVGQAAPAYDLLPLAMQDLVESVWMRFADLFDSPNGGPNLQTYFQAHFGRHRIAQLMGVALSRLNTFSQPRVSYTLDKFPLNLWSGVLEQATYVQVLRHLIRSYAEQPAEVGVNVAHLDRRDYMQRWQAVLDSEASELREGLEVFKIAHMGLGRPRVLVGGGVYGVWAPARLPYSVVARPRFWATLHA